MFCISFLLFSFQFFINVLYLNKGVNEALTHEVVRNLIWKKRPREQTIFKKPKTVKNPICCKQLAPQTNLYSLATRSKFSFIPPSSIGDVTGY